jgi:hypothetical protein
METDLHARITLGGPGSVMFDYFFSGIDAES